MYCFSGSDPSSEISPFPPWVPDNFSKRNFLIWDPERFTIHSFKLIYDAVFCRMPDSSMTFLKVFSNTEHCNITCSLNMYFYLRMILFSLLCIRFLARYIYFQMMAVQAALCVKKIFDEKIFPPLEIQVILDLKCIFCVIIFFPC